MGHIGLLKEFLERSNEYLETNVELLRLKMIDKSSDVLSSLVTGIAVLLGIAIVLGILGIGLALYLGYLLGKLYYGFFIVGAFVGIAVLMLWVFRARWVKIPVCNSILKRIFS
jgi:hypothetical protein